MRTSAKLSIAFCAALLPTIGVLRNAGRHAPIQDGTAQQFWLLACGVDVLDSGEQRTWGGIYPPKGEWAIYYHQGYHDQFLFRVRLEEVARFTPEVITRLEERQRQGDLSPPLRPVLESLSEHESDPPDVRTLLDLIRSAELDWVWKENRKVHAYLLESERLFDERWRRAQWYWLTLTFESLWLGGVVVFAAIPWICNSNRARWAIHLGLTPTLLFLPYYLGYAPYTFTSAFPGGGVFYPYVLLWFRVLPRTGFDAWLLQFAPQLFEPFAQQAGPMFAITNMGRAGPVSTCVVGVLLGAAPFAAGAAKRAIRSQLDRRESTSGPGAP